MVSRRSVLKIMAASSVLPTVFYSRLSWADENKIIIVGGGAAGTIAARTLKKFIPSLQITLIEKNQYYQPAYYSGEILADLQVKNQGKFDYQSLQNSGIAVVVDKVIAIDADSKKITLQSGKSLAYDRLLIATGTAVDYTSVVNNTKNSLHAWNAGEQAQALHQQLKAMKSGGTVIISVPKGEISGPWAPFERVSYIARYLSKANAKAKIFLFDGRKKSSIAPLIEPVWKTLYPGMIDVHYEMEVSELGEMLVKSRDAIITADVINLIPRNIAGELLQKSGLTDESLWCPVQVGTFESTKQKSIHVIGDAISSISGLSKTAQSANAQAKMCALALTNLIQGKNMLQNLPPLIDSEYCILGEKHALSQTKIFRFDEKGKFYPISEGQTMADATEKLNIRDARYALSWKNNISQEMFG